jgi:coenzyme F420-reducing hydrogenase delta subunit/Pyruvate/2-oxoacid:ferredoxin oxidoreductase delta subunit
LILGRGECARLLAERLSRQSFEVTVAAADEVDPMPALAGGSITLWSGGRLVDCQGQAGAFQVTVDHDGQRMVRRVGSIVVAEQARHLPNFTAYGLKPSGRVLCIAEAEKRMAGDGFAATARGAASVLFLNDWAEQCHPVTAARMLGLCLAVQQSGRRTVYMSGQLKVSGDGMEVCCQSAKAAGTVFFKFDREFPKLEELKDGRIQAAWQDDTMHLALAMSFDYVVVDEKIVPDPSLAGLARVLRLDQDLRGFVQSDNVHRWGNATNRRGIFVAGGSRAILSPEAQQADAGHAALKVAEFLTDLDFPMLPRVEIDAGRCARCLTCYRLCPHAAIEMTPRMTIMPQACQSCGLCAAGCPNRAIQVRDDQLDATLQRLMIAETGPRLVAFCCQRSAMQAREMAIAAGHRLPAGLVVVEGICGGSFSVRHLLSALEAGADGILVLTCHPGNCHSEQGPRNAQQRVAAAVQALALADISAERLQFDTLAANMGAVFASRLQQFAQKIAALGPIAPASVPGLTPRAESKEKT